MKTALGMTFIFLGTVVCALAEDTAPPRDPPPAGMTKYRRGVIGGPHDLSGPFGRFSDACRACHIPHIEGVRPTSQPTAELRVDLYRIPGQRPVFETDRYTPGPTSLICLGCHDGTIATSTIGSSHAMLAGVRAGFDVPDAALMRDHPIGIPYPVNRRDYRPSGFVTANGRVRLPDGKVECVSCHDPHNASGTRAMLAIPNRRSALCLTCHIK